MTTITRIALAHRRLVALAWIALAVVGGVTASSTTSRLTHTFATPGSPGYETNQRIIKSFGIDGNEQPTIAVLHLPAGQSMHTSAGQAAAVRTFAAAHNAGHLAVADYANTHNPLAGSPCTSQG
jgi:putative drug exporter of the RND superfamily